MKDVYDVVGIGAGPSNLAVAINIYEDFEHLELKTLFVEQKEYFEWHPGMLLNNAELQVSFIKDLVTMRNPSSQYTFLNYLKAKDRLSTFANLRTFFPTRIEFNDYLSWVAEKFQDMILYSSQVVSIELDEDSNDELFKIEILNLNTKNSTMIYAKNVIVATGLTPKQLSNDNVTQNSAKIWHTSEYLNRVKEIKSNRSKVKDFSVVGQGQSAAEIIRDLYNNFPDSNITCIFSKFGFMPADDSEFVNEIFNSEIVDLLHSIPKKSRNKLIKDHYNTNYAPYH